MSYLDFQVGKRGSHRLELDLRRVPRPAHQRQGTRLRHPVAGLEEQRFENSEVCDSSGTSKFGITFPACITRNCSSNKKSATITRTHDEFPDVELLRDSLAELGRVWSRPEEARLQRGEVGPHRIPGGEHVGPHGWGAVECGAALGLNRTEVLHRAVGGGGEDAGGAGVEADKGAGHVAEAVEERHAKADAVRLHTSKYVYVCDFFPH